MNTLLDILLLKYHTESECLSFVKLLAYRGAFSNPVKYVSEQKYEYDAIRSTYEKFAKQIEAIWNKTQLSEYPIHSRKMISDAEGIKLLKINFPSLKEGLTGYMQ